MGLGHIHTHNEHLALSYTAASFPTTVQTSHRDRTADDVENVRCSGSRVKGICLWDMAQQTFFVPTAFLCLYGAMAVGHCEIWVLSIEFLHDALDLSGRLVVGHLCQLH